jgi:hypothetical protein
MSEASGSGRHHPEGGVRPRDQAAVRREIGAGKAERAASLDVIRVDDQPRAHQRGVQTVNRQRDGDEAGQIYSLRAHAAHDRAAKAHGPVARGGDQAAMRASAGIGVRLAQPQADEQAVRQRAPKHRLPLSGQRAVPGAEDEALGRQLELSRLDSLVHKNILNNRSIFASVRPARTDGGRAMKAG